VVERVTAGFFGIEARRGRMTPAKLEREGNQAGVSNLTSAPSVPLYPPPPFVGDPCALPPGAPTD